MTSMLCCCSGVSAAGSFVPALLAVVCMLVSVFRLLLLAEQKNDCSALCGTANWLVFILLYDLLAEMVVML